MLLDKLKNIYLNLNKVSTLEHLYRYVLEQLENNFNPDFIIILQAGDNYLQYSIKNQRGNCRLLDVESALHYLSFHKTDDHNYCCLENFPLIDRNNQKRLANLHVIPFPLADERKCRYMFLAAKAENLDYSQEDILFLESIVNYLSVKEQQVIAKRERQLTFINVVSTLLEILDLKDITLSAHAKRVHIYSLYILNQLEMEDGYSFDRSFRENLQLAALLHDIGKISLAENILTKPPPLDRSDFSQIVQAIENGTRILAKIKPFTKIIPAITHLNEYYNGGGFPNGLAGDEIPLISRILAVANAFDAMTTNRYGKKMNQPEAMAQLQKSCQVQFDGQVVNAFYQTIQNNEDILMEMIEEYS